MALNFSGDLARCEQNYARAQAAYGESISLVRELDAVRDLASALHKRPISRWAAFFVSETLHPLGPHAQGKMGPQTLACPDETWHPKGKPLRGVEFR
jgi:hypothetical protein